MTSVALIKKSWNSETTGVLNSVMSYGVQTKVQSNRKLYFYRFDASDLVEMYFRNDNLTITHYSDTKTEMAHKIKENEELKNRIVAYIKAANLENCRFLFDVDLGMAVNYNDFVEKDFVPGVDKENIAFILDKKEGYVTGIESVYLYSTSLYSPNIDRAILCLLNNSIGVNKPKDFRLAGCEASIITSGLLSGIRLDSIISDIDRIDSSKFTNSINKLDYNSENLNSILGKLKIDKVKRIMLSSKKEIEPFSDEDTNVFVPLSFIMQIGLDQYLKGVSDGRIIKIDVDAEPQTIRAAYIENGMLYICPTTLRDISYYKDLVDSDNVSFIFN